jgi:hypothetical protein
LISPNGEGKVLNGPETMLSSTATAQSRIERGALVAQLLAGSWRPTAERLSSSAEELSLIVGLLTRSGAGGLAWCRVRNTALRDENFSHELHHFYRYQSLEAALHNRSLKRVIPLLRNAGVEPLLVKGWAIARLYPELGMRPYSDLDLCVYPEQYARAASILQSPELLSCDVDLHAGFGKFYGKETEEIFARSELVKLEDVEVRIPSPEDHLRLLCVHLLRHGAVKPLWLCDIGLLLEAVGDKFDWDRCLAGSRRNANWVICVIALAHQLLGLEIEGTPIATRARSLPRWMVPTVLKEWGTPYSFPHQVSAYLRNPVRMWRGLLNELPRHWPNPIEATASVRGPFNDAPRLPFQVGHVISRGTALIFQLPELLSRRSSS